MRPGLVLLGYGEWRIRESAKSSTRSHTPNFHGQTYQDSEAQPQEWQISYVISHDAKFLTFEIVENGADYLDETLVVLDDHLDLSFPRRLKTYDKFGYRLLLRKFRYYFFGSERAPLTKKRCEEFFEDPSSFLEQGPSIVPEPITQSESASA